MAPVRQRVALCACVALVAFLPFARGALQGRSFFFRDLSGHFIPLRAFALDGLRHGELRYWNPLLHEGEPMSLAPLAYFPDVLQAILPRYSGISLLLALHVPLAALCFMALASRLGVDLTAAAGGAMVYALGGFCLSSLNLYIYLPAIAWAPLVILGLIRAGERGLRSVALASVAVALALSTTGIEIVGQAVAIGVLLAAASWRRGPRAVAGWGRVIASLALGAGLSAHILFYASGLVGASARGAGFETSVVLAHSAHPLTLLQVLVAGLYGDPSDLTTHWWGQNFFPLGFPYFLSLYVGAAALAVSAVGIAAAPARLRWTLLVLVVGGTLACLGRYARLDVVVDAFPLLRLFRYPTKLFFSVHTGLALAAALGLQALAAGGRRAWMHTALAACALGAPLAAGPWLPSLFGRATAWFAAGFFPPEYPWPLRLECLSGVLRDAAAGGGVALCAAALAALVLQRRLHPRLASASVATLVAADLLRAGAGLNPMVDDSFFRLSPEMSSWASAFRARGARVFTCEPELEPAFLRIRQALPLGQDAWTFAAMTETLVPAHNVEAGVETAMSRDRTMAVPTERTLAASEVGCRSFADIEQRLRRAGVSHVLSVVPLSSASLRLLDVVAPARVAPLRVYVYALEAPLPLREVARSVRAAADRAAALELAAAPGFQHAGGVAVEGAATETFGATGRIVRAAESPSRLDFTVEADRATVLVVRDAFAPGWRAWVDGAPTPILRADGRHRAIAVPRGMSSVALAYRPPRLAAGCGVTLAAAAVWLGIWLAGSRGARLTRPRRGP